MNADPTHCTLALMGLSADVRDVLRARASMERELALRERVAAAAHVILGRLS